MKNDTSFFGLNRPEYIPSRELFMSELAWSLTPEGAPHLIDRELGQGGLAFNDRSSKKTANVKTTRPLLEDERFVTISAGLMEDLGLRSKEDANAATQVLLHELEAPSSAGATRSVATPLTLHAAFLQDRRGVTGKKNPANIALILEQMYAMGGGAATVAGQWAKAQIESGDSGLPKWTSEAIAGLVPAPFSESIDSAIAQIGTFKPRSVRRPRWLDNAASTPFHWFACSWDRLCSKGWIDSMPRRRWTDWAACVARTAIATSYMFEMHLTRRLVSALASDVPAQEAVTDALEDGHRLFVWDDRLGRTAADVGPTMNRLAATGTECLTLLSNLINPDDDWEGIKAPSEFDDNPNGLSEWLTDSRGRLQDQGINIEELISQALDSVRSGSANNVWETMRYSLLDRSESGAGDLYALLRSAGRYTWVEAGQEWLVTVASLQAPSPQTLCRLTDLQEALSSLGIEASPQTLVSRLEGYGLARSSHDADDALEIMAGF